MYLFPISFSQLMFAKHSEPLRLNVLMEEQSVIKARGAPAATRFPSLSLASCCAWMLLHHDLLRWCCGSLFLHGGIWADNAKLLFPHNWKEFLIMRRDVSSARSLDAFQPQPDPMTVLRFLLFWHSTCELSAPFWEWFLKIIRCCSSFSLMAQIYSFC